MDKRELRVGSKEGTGLLDSWVLRTWYPHLQERILPQTGEVYSQRLFEWVSPVLQLTLANSLETHSLTHSGFQNQVPQRPNFPEEPPASTQKA